MPLLLVQKQKIIRVMLVLKVALLTYSNRFEQILKTIRRFYRANQKLLSTKLRQSLSCNSLINLQSTIYLGKLKLGVL